MTKDKVIEKLTERLTALRDLHANMASEPSFKKWRRDTEVAFEYIFGKDTRHIRDLKGISFTPGSYDMMNPDPAFARAYVAGKLTAEAVIQSVIDEVKEYWPDKDSEAVTEDPIAPTFSRRVFLVHGHNEGARESVARLMEKLDLEPIILHEQANRGRTIIEKFLDFSDVGFAVVLLTADDCGGKASDSPDSYKRRARQNVILELGFFLGRIGRERVCALYEDGVEIPSDYDGVVFIPFDKAGGWRLLLGRELRAAGLCVDINRIA